MRQSGRQVARLWGRVRHALVRFVHLARVRRYPFIAVVLGHYRRALGRLEAVQIGSSTDVRVRELAEEAVSLHKVITDLEGENYRATVHALELAFHAKSRLERFLEAARGRLGLMADQKLFHLSSHPPPCYRGQEGGFRTFELGDYLAYLEHEALGEGLPLPAGQEAWFDLQSAVHERLLAYLGFLVERGSPGVGQKGRTGGRFLCLLRDGLLVYLGLRRLQKAGRVQDVRASLVSRAVLRTFAPEGAPEQVYDRILQTLYRKVQGEPESRSELVRRFSREVRRQSDPGLVRLLGFVEEQCAALPEGGGFCAVDTGANGTLPLVFLTASPRVDDFVLFSAYPWLQPLYAEALCSRSYAQMRELEATVCQEHLFFFERLSGGKTFVKETSDVGLRAVGYEEIRRFLSAVDARFLSGGVV